MKNKAIKLLSAVAISAVFTTSAYAVPVTINMTADNLVTAGGLCDSASCQGGFSWNSLGNTAGFDNWTQSTSISLDLDYGTHTFVWQVNNLGAASSGNPAGLLAEILWDGNANYSSSAWEIFDISGGSAISNATEYGNNGGANTWTSANGGAVSGISTNANWIYTADNFATAPETTWIRTSITILEVSQVPEPGSLALLGLGLAGLGFARRKA